MTASRRLAALPLMLIALAALAVLVLIPWAVQAQSQEVTPTAGATGDSPPAKPTNRQASAEHDSVTLTWTASTDQTVTHYAILRRHPDTDASQVFHVIESNAGPETSYTDSTVSASSTYIYRVKAVSPTGVSQWSGYVKAETPAAPDPAPTPEPESTPDPADLRPTGLTVDLVENKVTLSWAAPAEDADSVTGYEILRRRPMEGESTLATLVSDTESTATTYTDATANEAGVRYVYRVKALRGSEASLWSNFDRIELPSDYVPDPTPTPEPESTPDDQAPTGLTAALADGAGVSLSWAAPAEDADSVTGYEVLRAVGEGELATLAADTASTATSYTDATATATAAGETYAYQVKAIRGEDRSQASGEAQVQVPHDPVDLAPSNLTALIETRGVALTWSAPAEDADSVTGYEILRAVGEGDIATLVADTASTATTYTDATATEAGETYAYQVKAIRGEVRSEASGQAQVQVPHDPVDLAPSNLTALISITVGLGEEASTTKVVLIWTAPAEDADSVTGYEVLRALGEGELATLAADTGSATNTYTDATATEAGETYAYQVKAIRGEERSQASGQAQVQLPHDPVDLAPSNLTAEKVDGGINLSWTAPAADTDSVTGYEVLRAVGEGELATLAADTGSTTNTYTDATATDSEETYAYQVKAIRGQARSQGSNKVIEAPEPPATPENLAPSGLVFVIQEDGVELTWDAPAADADSVTGYRVLRRRPNQGENEWLVWEWNTGSTETTHKDGYAQTLGEYYMYRVRALRGDEYSKMSNRVDVRRPEAAPETTAWAPSNLEALVYGEVTLGEEGVTTKVKLTWDAPADGTEWVRGYEVQRATCDGGFTTLVADTGSTGTAYTDVSVTPGESYTYRVRARRPQGLSLTSNTWTLLTPGGTGESDCAVPVGAPEPEPVGGEDVTYAFSQHDTTVLIKNTGKAVDTTPSLYSVTPKRAQGFRTGANTTGYTLGSIGVYFATIDNTADAGDVLIVTLNAASGGDPGSALCTLTDPASFTANAVNTFDAPGTCPTLAARATYYVQIERTSFGSDDILLNRTGSTGEDTGGQMGWFVLNDSRTRSGTSWLGSNNAPHLIDVRGGVIAGGVPERALVKNIGQDPDNYFAQDLTATANRRAQVFTTGANAGGYTLDFIGIDFDTIADTSMAGSRLTVTLNADSSSDPGSALCTLTDPTTFTARTVNTFAAPATCPTLAASTDYFVLIHRVNTTGGTISVRATTDFGEDAGDVAGWSIGNRRHSRISAVWISASGPLLIEVKGALAPVVLGTPLVKNTGQTVHNALALNDNITKRAQQFTTGADTYTLGSIGFDFGTISNTSTAGSQLTITLSADSNGTPGDALCTLTAPTFTSSGVQTFDAPATCPALAASTAYFAVIDRVTFVSGDTITLNTAASDNEDAGGALGWSIGDERHFFSSSSWRSSASQPYVIEVTGAAGGVTPPPVVLEPGQGVVVVKNAGQTADRTAQTLIANRPRLAQQFTTGTSAAGYRLGSISVDFDSIGNTSTAGSQLKVTLNYEGILIGDRHPDIPGDVVCTLSDPATFTGTGVHTFDGPATCPTLEPGRNYFVVVRREAFEGGIISLVVTTSADEDSGGAAGWSIRDRRAWYLPKVTNDPTGFGWRKVDSESHLIEVSAAAVVFDEEDPINKHFNTLLAAGNQLPRGLWSDGDTMWVVGARDAKIYAYALIHRRTACRRPAEETEGCASESGIMVLKQKTGPRKGAPDRCYHVTTPTASKSPSTTTAWWPMPG